MTPSAGPFGWPDRLVRQALMWFMRANPQYIMDRRLWTSSVRETRCPAWPCPTCANGVATLVPKSLKSFESAKSRAARGHPEFDLEWIEMVFTAHAECSNPKCKEKFVLAGRGGVDYEITGVDDNDQPDYEIVETFRPLICEPMPNMIDFPAKCPTEVQMELREAFKLFWVNPNSVAGRIRCALEKLMDYLKIPSTQTTPKGKLVNLDLHSRIEEFSKVDPIQGKLLMALKIVGNTGSHQSSINKNDILDALEIVEHSLNEIIDNRSARIAKLAQQLSAKHKR